MSNAARTLKIRPDDLAGIRPTKVFQAAFERETPYRYQGVISFTGWSTLLLVDHRERPGDLLVAKGMFGYNSVLAAAPPDLRAELYGYYWYRELPDNAHAYALSQFCQEIGLMQQFQNSGICPQLICADPEAAIPYYVMEYQPQGSVRHWRQQHGPLSEAEALGFACSLLKRIACMHERRVVHRDLNAENLLMSDRGPVIADFGCALLPRVEETPSLKAPLISWPPEYDDGYHLASPVSDLYCFGMVMYEMLTGTMPRYGAPALPAVTAAYDRRLLALIEECLSWLPERRPDSALACLRYLGE
jgi:serine/threonine protein kinase